MSNRELIILGTASQAPTRRRSHNGYVLRWDDQLIMFDPGEGAQRQCIMAEVSIARLTAVCVTHFHGDHSLGLPGVIQRRSLDAGGSQGDGLPPLPILFPAPDIQYFERLRTATIFHDNSNVVPVPVDERAYRPGIELGELTVTVAPLQHRVVTIGYRLQAPDRRRVDAEALARQGITGPDVGRLIAAGRLDTDRGSVTLEEFSTLEPGASFAFIMDTAVCDAAVDLAGDADLAVFESTFLETESRLARRYGHLTAADAGRMASEAGVRRLVLSHFSGRYPINNGFGEEAARHHPDVVVAKDLDRIEVPPRP